MPESTPERRKAEEAFHSFLESGSANDVTAREAFLNQHSQQLRPHLEDLLRDYDFLRRELPQSPDQSWQGRVLGDYSWCARSAVAAWVWFSRLLIHL